MGIRLAYVVTHPIQYQAPLLRLIARQADIDLKVFFLSDFSVREHYEPSFRQKFVWDIPLTEGYEWESLSTSDRQSSSVGAKWRPARGLKAKLRDGRFDAVWVHGWGQTGLRQAIRYAHSLGLPVLFRGEATRRENAFTDVLRKTLRHQLLNKISAFLCIGTLNREFYSWHGIPESQMFLTPYAVDNSWFRSRCEEFAHKREEFRESLGLERGRQVILFAAKLISVKAPEDLLNAFLQLNSEARPYLLFVGDGPERAKLEAQAIKSRDDDVRFLGFRNQREMPALYDLCDVFVLPSRFEPWGLVINEVMNAGRPVIVSDRVGAARDLVRDGENGWIFPHKDIRALCECLQKALANPDLHQMGFKSRLIIEGWNFEADLDGLRAALSYVT